MSMGICTKNCGFFFSRISAGMALVLGASFLGCIHSPPKMNDRPSVAQTPEKPWEPSPEDTPTPSTVSQAQGLEIAEVTDQPLTLAKAVDLALRNNPQTTISWQNAMAAAYRYGMEKGQYFPSLNLDLLVQEGYQNMSGRSPGSSGSTAGSSGGGLLGWNTMFGPSLSLSYLLFNFGGRSGSIENAKQVLIAANFTHNTTLQNLMLQVELAYFRILALQALLEANRINLQEAQTFLDAVSARHTAGVATRSDELLAKTALSQTKLSLQTTQGALQTSLGSLALALGFAANQPLSVEALSEELPSPQLQESIDHLIQKALTLRPELAAAKARVLAAQGQLSKAQSDGLPALLLSGNAGRYYINGFSDSLDMLSAGLIVRFPLFSGLSQTYNLRRAESELLSMEAQQKNLENQIVFEVFAAFQSLQTASERLRTVTDLLDSATQSEQVALERYRAGVGSMLELLSAQAALADARAQEIQARLDWRASLAQLAYYSGMLETPDEPLPQKNPSESQTREKP